MTSPYNEYLGSGLSEVVNSPDITGDVTAIRSSKIAMLRTAASAQIVAGFTSSALGREHVYPSAPVDQANLSASVVASMLPGVDGSWSTPFWVLDPASGIWSFADHSAEQIQKAGADGKAAVVSAQTKLARLTDEAEKASTVGEIEQISWLDA
jgi:hypothetical protein